MVISPKKNLKVSVITVCKNAVGTIEKTIKSVANQDYGDIEYIIIDGKSNDGTINIIQKYKNKVTSFVSELDKGIYDAMNKGLNLVSGDIIFFLNANDMFYAKDVVSSIAAEFETNKGTKIIYGDIVTVDEKSGVKILNRFNGVSKFFLVRNTICHQAIFARTELFHKYGFFDTKYKIAADYDWLLRLSVTNKIKLRYMKKVMVYFSLNGISANSQYHKQAYAEHKEIASRFFGPTIVGLGSFITSFTKFGSKVKKIFSK